LTARAYHQLGLGLLPLSRAQQTSALASARRRFFGRPLSHHRPSRLSGQIVGPVLASRRSLVTTRMEFESDASVGPARFPSPAWLSLTAHFGQASTYGREIVGSARSGHGVFSQLGRVLLAQYSLRAGAWRG
jgi:hypothetical protein